LRHDRVSTQEHLVSTAVGQLRAWLANGGMVLFVVLNSGRADENNAAVRHAYRNYISDFKAEKPSRT
jgi:hypothetical protein